MKRDPWVASSCCRHWLIVSWRRGRSRHQPSNRVIPPLKGGRCNRRRLAPAKPDFNRLANVGGASLLQGIGPQLLGLILSTIKLFDLSLYLGEIFLDRRLFAFLEHSCQKS